MIPTAVLALFASLAYGSSDFVAGIASRRVSSVAVALWSQLAGAAALVVALFASGQRLDVSGVLWGTASGVVAAVGVLVFYRALALAYATTSGSIGVVSVLASLDILVTVLLARFVLAERLPRLQSVGVVLSVVGVILVSSG